MSGGEDGIADGWATVINGRASVVCLLCGSPPGPGAPFWGCAVCGEAAPLTLSYQASPRSELTPLAAAREAWRAFAPLALSAAIGLPSRPPTPLDPAPRFGPAVHVKNEAFSLTGSHKDRYHVVAAPVARLLGSRGVVASSTGNHGVSAAAHAAANGLRAVVFCHPEAPAGLLRAIAAFGGLAAQLEPEAQQAALVSLVQDGWFPATSLDPVLSGAANPCAAEGYKAIAYEIVAQLGAAPRAVFVPTAGGDTLYGIMKGFAEIADLSGTPLPAVFAVQPQGANPLSRSLASGRQVTVDDPSSIALSLSDRVTGRHAMAALTRWGGQALDVTEEAIREAVADLAATGVYPDPASAAALAGYRRALALGAIDEEAAAVLLLTSSGFKWPDAMAEVFPARSARSVDELQQWLSRISLDPAVAGG